jgi:CRP/FNR family transcriptional regulator
MSTSPTYLTHPAKSLDVDGSSKSKLFESGAQRQWARHQMLCTAGKPVTTVHQIVSGVLARSITLSNGRRQIVDFLFTGDICGLVQSNGSHMFDCEAITDATTCGLDASFLRKATGARPDVGKAIEEEVVRALSRAGEHLVTVGKLSTVERLLRFLHWLEEAYAERGMPTHPLALPMSRSDIGDYLGMQQESVSRAFAKLKEQDVVDQVSAAQVLLLHRPKAARPEGVETSGTSAFLYRLRCEVSRPWHPLSSRRGVKRVATSIKPPMA